MKHNIIKTENYLLVVDEREIKVGDWYYVPRTNKAYKCQYDPTELEMEKRFGVRKVIAHLPLNGSPILEDVDLLPPLEEDDVEKLALTIFPRHENWTLNSDNADKRPIWIDGYNKAKEKYKYTEEDIIRIVEKSRATGLTAEYLMLTLSQPKMPNGFELQIGVCERWLNEEDCTDNCCGIPDKKITTTTPEGHTQWVGTYIY